MLLSLIKNHQIFLAPIIIQLILINTSFAFNKVSCSILFTITNPATVSQQFFDSKASQPTIAKFNLQADFNEAIKKSGGGNWTGEDRPYSEFGIPANLIIPATLSQQKLSQVPEVNIKTMMRIRGMSSVENSPLLPKLKIKLNTKENKRHPLVQNIKGFRINTSGFFGLDRAPYREALLYEFAEVLNFPTVKIQRAEINYQQIPHMADMQKKLYETEALLIENDQAFLNRTGLKEYYPDLMMEFNLDHQEAARFYLFHAMIGNADFGLKTRNENAIPTEKYRPLFNTMLVYKYNETEPLRPIIYDLDKAAMVHMQNPRSVVKSQLIQNNINQIQLNQLMMLMKLKQKFTDAEIDFAINDLQKHKEQLFNLLNDRKNQNLVRQSEFQILENMLNQFFNLLPMVHQFDLNLQETRVYRSPSLKTTYQLRKNKFSDDYVQLRPGTPMRILKIDQFNQSMQIAFLDLREDFPAHTKTGEIIAYIPLNTPIGKTLSIENLGFINEQDMFH